MVGHFASTDSVNGESVAGLPTYSEKSQGIGLEERA
jgi:hypothetical protein